MIYSILSATNHDYYAAPLPFTVWSWAKLGIHSKVFVPKDYEGKLSLAMTYCDPETDFYTFECEKHKEPTYAQVSRLFGGCIKGVSAPDCLITGDADLAVFNKEYFTALDNGEVNLVGSDLLDPSMNQYPMCFIAMSAFYWSLICPSTGSYQDLLDEFVGRIQDSPADFRSNLWALDQHLAYKWINNTPVTPRHWPRAALPNHWASRRADRDGWHFDPNDILDAHLPRPIMQEDNFNKMIQLFKDIYPNDNLEWMYEYRAKYLEL